MDGYHCQYPKRIATDVNSPFNLRAVDLYLDKACLCVSDAHISEGLPLLLFQDADYPSHLPRLRELAEAQRLVQENERYATLVGGFLRGQD